MATDVRRIVPWVCQTGPSDKCKLCRNPALLSVTFEVSWIEYNESQYVSEACGTCTRALIERDPVMMTYEYWKQPCQQRNFDTFWECGLVSPHWLQLHHIDKPPSRSSAQPSGGSTDLASYSPLPLSRAAGVAPLQLAKAE